MHIVDRCLVEDEVSGFLFFPFALLSALTTLGCRALTAWKLIHILLLRGSPGADFFGTMMTELAHGETLMLSIVYPNYPSFSDNYFLSRVIPKVPAGTWIGEHMHGTCLLLPTQPCLLVANRHAQELTWYPIVLYSII